MRGAVIPATVLFIGLLGSFVAEYWSVLLAVAVVVALGVVLIVKYNRGGRGAWRRRDSGCEEENEEKHEIRHGTAVHEYENDKVHGELRSQASLKTKMVEREVRADGNFLLQPKHVRRKYGKANDPWYDGPKHKVRRESGSRSNERRLGQLDVELPATTPWHSVKSDVYHNHASCRKGSKIRPEHIRLGTGGRNLCVHCAVLSGIVGGKGRNPA